MNTSFAVIFIDVDEFLEVVVLDGVDPASVTVTLYNGNGGVPYGSPMNVATDFAFGESDGSWSVYYIILPANGLQNGSPDGLCIDINGVVAEFLSYEGVIDATAGPAAGMSSIDIGVMEGGGTTIGSSLGLTGDGAAPVDFIWTELVDLASPGLVNNGQQVIE